MQLKEWWDGGPQLLFEYEGIEEVWTSDLPDNHHHELIEPEGYLCGSCWIHHNAGAWACLDWNTGEVRYEEDWNSIGEQVYADGMF